MVTYYKATRPDGTDFQTGRIDYAAALASGEVIRHPGHVASSVSASGNVKVTKIMVKNDASTYLSVSIAPADCTGFSWPCRLFRVEPVGRTMEASDLPNKRACWGGATFTEALAALAVTA